MLALALTAGCGDEEFADEANQACRDGREQIEAAGTDGRKLVAAGEVFVAELKAVDVSGDEESDYKAWVATQEEYFAEFEAALRSGEERRVDALDETAGDDQARELGLDDCVG